MTGPPEIKRDALRKIEFCHRILNNLRTHKGVLEGYRREKPGFILFSANRTHLFAVGSKTAKMVLHNEHTNGAKPSLVACEGVRQFIFHYLNLFIFVVFYFVQQVRATDKSRDYVNFCLAVRRPALWIWNDTTKVLSNRT